MNKSKNTDFISIILIVYIFLFVNTNVYTQTINCPCQPGGKFDIGDEFPDTLNGSMSSKDFAIEIDKACWDFGTHDQIPDDGIHYFDRYNFTVSQSGEYKFAGSDNNKLILGLYIANSWGKPTCDNLILGLGGYIVRDSLLQFEEPQDSGMIKNIVSLDTGKIYTLLVVDYDAEFIGNYHISIKAVNQGQAFFAKRVYAEECVFSSCYEDTASFDIPIPEIPNDYSIDWDDDIFWGDNCGEQKLLRHYTITDANGDQQTCTSEYFFTGTDLLKAFRWPVNWDGLQGNNPILYCNNISKIDANGNPHTDITGIPEGFSQSCGTIEDIYQDSKYQLTNKVKILREWTLVNDCTGEVLTHIQVIVVKNDFSFEEIVGDTLRFSTNPMSCKADIVIPKLPVFGEKCSIIDKYWVTFDSDTIMGDTDDNGLYDSTETWVIHDLALGEYNLCYHMVDTAGVESEKCVDLLVFDGKPPIPACKMLNINYPYCGLTKIAAVRFNGNSFDNCGSLYFKARKVDNVSEYDAQCNYLEENNSETDSWYKDSISICSENVTQGKLMVSLRVLDIDPGSGDVNPERFGENGDLKNHYRDCWAVINFQDTLKPFIECTDILLSCDESLNPDENNKLYPKTERGCLYDLEYSDQRLENCGNEILRTWKVSIDNVESTCQQHIFLPDSTLPFDPCTIVFPGDIKTNCAGNLDKAPVWESNVCNDISAKIINEDTFDFTEEGYFKIIRDWAVIDHCVYQANSGAENNVDITKDQRLICDSLLIDGYYRYSQVILVYDVLPDIIDCPKVEITCSESLSPDINPKLSLDILGLCNYDTRTYTDNHFDQHCDNIVKRTWTISNGIDTSYCQQEIRILPDKVFNPCTIVFPERDIDILYKDLDNLETPTWTDDHCNDITAEIVKEDTIVEDSHRFKLIREWAVIDWCKYDPGSQAESNMDSIANGHIDCSNLVNDGYYRYIQNIVVTKKNLIDVVVENSCIGIEDCYTQDVVLSARLIDSCGLDNNAQWKYIVTNVDTWITVQYSYNYLPHPIQGVVGDIQKDNIDSTDIASLYLLSGLSEGHYKVKWTVRGHCGNVKTVEQYFAVADKTAPTPITSDVSVVYLDYGIVEINAVDFDKGGCEGCIASIDNCATKDKLYFTFTDYIPKLWENTSKWEKQFVKYGKYFFDPKTGNISTNEAFLQGEADAWIPGKNTSQRRILKFTEDANPKNLPVRIYVWDKFAYDEECDDNNYAFSPIKIILEGEHFYNLNGRVTYLNSDIRFNGMNMIAEDTVIIKNTKTDGGYYDFNLKEGSYTISGTLDSNYLRGINIRDMILMKLFLLGLKQPASPYNLLSMDANNDGSITISDINSLLKILLREETEFENNSWIAISKDYEFANPAQALKELDEARIQKVDLFNNDVDDIDFYALKIGDTDNSIVDSIPQDTQTLDLVIKNQKFAKGDTVIVPVYSGNFNDVFGLQLSLYIHGAEFIGIENGALEIYENNYNEILGNLLLGIADFRASSFGKDEALFTLKLMANADSELDKVLQVDNLLLKSEAYRGDELKTSKISLEIINTDAITQVNSSPKYKLCQNVPNPFSKSSKIEFRLPKASKYKLSIFDITGKEIKSYAGMAKGGINQVKIEKKDLYATGILFYRLEVDEFVDTKRMIVF